MCSNDSTDLKGGGAQAASGVSPGSATASFSFHPALLEYQRIYDFARFRIGPHPFVPHHQAGSPYGLPSSGSPYDPAMDAYGLSHPLIRFDPTRTRFLGAAEEPKPQHSYIGLIAMAILSSHEKKMVLSDIYQYILDHYPYFRNRGPGWRNSIRHNLSLNDCFIKAGRSANGKGHYWAIHPANEDDFRKGDFRRRKAQQLYRKKGGCRALASVGNEGSTSASSEEVMDSTASVSNPDDLETDEEKSMPSNSEIVVALFDYDPRTDEDLGMKKGQEFEIIVEENRPRTYNSEWIQARSLATNEQGYIPLPYVARSNSLESQPWYFGVIDRMEATERLLAPGNSPGSFLLRVTKRNSHMWSLSVRSPSEIKHYMISHSENGYVIMNSEQNFNSLIDLVKYYSEHQNGLCMPLLSPCINKSKPTTRSLAYHLKDKWEIDRNSLVLIRKLGQGYYGEVWEGIWNNRKRVAVKTFNKETTNKASFLAEASIMKQLSHPNLVQLYAVCTDDDPIYIVTELMINGNLQDYLRSPAGKNLPLSRLLYMAIQVAKGMHYLEQKHFLHRDLAARNVLVGEDYLVKVSDFGFAKFIEEDVYQSKRNFKLPVKWSAPEVLRRHLFSVKSDVWAFGILLIEMTTNGQTPYPGMKNDQVIENLREGYRIPSPKSCPKHLYKIITYCWNEDPAKRPGFGQLIEYLEEYLSTIDTNLSYNNYI
ncbi:Src42A [Cordylochernes scorpioides]|uniref:Tyrosine-protein kinase n=1 Tax=Cordylochernes scorpioides TaxID=51811 RepID=A0ABY6LP58_9ARAC|nr:Src42A [Cordylochernes scorpioides]